MKWKNSYFIPTFHKFLLPEEKFAQFSDNNILTNADRSYSQNWHFCHIRSTVTIGFAISNTLTDHWLNIGHRKKCLPFNSNIIRYLSSTNIINGHPNMRLQLSLFIVTDLILTSWPPWPFYPRVAFFLFKYNIFWSFFFHFSLWNIGVNY